MKPELRDNLKRLFNPRHIAFVGGKDAGIAIIEARRAGFAGRLWPVNPNRKTLEGLGCFSSVDKLPEAPDAVFLAIPVSAAIEVVCKLRDMGAGGVVCYTAGFGEAGRRGRVAENALIEAAGSLALIGPNCYGAINYLDRVALWPFSHGGKTLGYGCAIITQSGMLASDITMSQRSVPLTHIISTGNQAVLAIEDFVDFLSEDERVRAIGLHIEGLKDVVAFSRAAIKATRMGKAIVALKTGSSKIGKALTASHTGSVSGEDDLYDALFERVGIVRVFSPAQLLETLKFLSICGLLKGKNIAGFTCSGSGAVMLADRAEKIGLAFPSHGDAVKKELIPLLPSIATVTNPLDYTTLIWGQPEFTKPVFAKAIGNKCDVALLVQDYPASGLDESKDCYLADADAFCKVAKSAGIPAAICSTLPENLDSETRRDFLSRQVAPMQGINEALSAIAAASKLGGIHEKIRDTPPADLISIATVGRHKAIDESAAKEILDAADFPTPKRRVVSADDLEKATYELGFPLALKMVHPNLIHKTEAGALKLGLSNNEQVLQAARSLSKNVKVAQPDGHSNRFLVEQMLRRPLAELIISIRTDAQFGLAMTVGSGGILVELLEDVAIILLPASRDDVLKALKQLKISKLFRGFRGGPAVDFDMLATNLLRLAKFAEKNKEQIAEIEINPLFVYEDQIYAVDALIHITNEIHGSTHNVVPIASNIGLFTA